MACPCWLVGADYRPLKTQPVSIGSLWSARCCNSVAKIPLALVFGAALAVAGVGVFVRSGDKASIASATALVLVGGLQLLAAIHLH